MSGPVSPDVRAIEVTQAALGRPESPASKRVAEIREAIARDDSPASPLEKTRAALLEVSGKGTPSGSDRATNAFLDANFGTDRDPATGKIVAKGESLARQTEVSTSITQAREAQRFDSLPKTQQDQIITIAEKLLVSIPGVEATLPPKGTKARRDWIAKRYLGDPRITERIGEKITTLGAERLSDDIASREASLSRAEAEHARKDGERSRLSSELTRISRRIDAFDPTAPTHPALDRLNGLTELRPALDTQLTTQQTQLASLTRRIDILTGLMGSKGHDPIEINKQIDALEGQRLKASQDLASTNKLIKEHDDLTAESARLPGERDSIQTQLKAAEKEVDAAFREELIAKADLNKATEQRGEDEAKLVARAGNIIQASIAEIVFDDLEVADGIYQQKLDEFITSSKDIAEKAIGKQVKGRYVQDKTQTRMDKIRGVTRTEANIIKAVSDFNIILADPVNGPKQLVERVLRDGLTADVKAGLIEAGEVDNIVVARMNDPEWVENMSLLVGGNTLREVGKRGPLKEAEAEIIAKSKLGERILQTAMSDPKENPPEVNAVVEELKKNGIVTPDKLDEKSKNWLLNALAILGSALIPVAKEGVNFNQSN